MAVPSGDSHSKSVLGLQGGLAEGPEKGGEQGSCCRSLVLSPSEGLIFRRKATTFLHPGARSGSKGSCLAARGRI